MTRQVKMRETDVAKGEPSKPMPMWWMRNQLKKMLRALASCGWWGGGGLVD